MPACIKHRSWHASSTGGGIAPTNHADLIACLIRVRLQSKCSLRLSVAPGAINANDNCPETLLLDAQRLVAAQNELQRLSLVGASLLVAQMLLGAKGVPAAPGAPDNRMCASPQSSQNPPWLLNLLLSASLLITCFSPPRPDNRTCAHILC